MEDASHVNKGIIRIRAESNVSEETKDSDANWMKFTIKTVTASSVIYISIRFSEMSLSSAFKKLAHHLKFLTLMDAAEINVTDILTH